MISVWAILVLTSSLIVQVTTVLTPDPIIVALLEKAEAEPDVAAIVGIEQTILGLLFSAGLAWTGVIIHHSRIGIHKVNRYGFGVSWARFHRLGAKIARLGYSKAAASSVICIEEDDQGSNAEFTVNIQKTADQYGKQQKHQIKYASLGGGHLNQLSVALDCEVPCHHANISVNGHMSKDLVCSKDPVWKDVLENGQPWTVLHKDLDKTYPKLCNLIQRARNAVSQNHSPEAIIELLLEINEIANEMEKSSDGVPNWKVLEQRVMQSEPPHTAAIPVLCQWVTKYGGGDAAVHLERLKQFVYVCVPADREIRPDIFSAINKWAIDDKHVYPEVALAILMAEYNCPVSKVEMGSCRFLKPNMVAAIANDPGPISKANDLLKQFRNWTKELGLPSKWKTAMDGKLYSLVAVMLLRYSVPAAFVDQPFEAALFEVAKEVLSLNDIKDKGIPNPWAAFERKSEPSSSSADAAPKGGLLQYNDEGEAVGFKRRFLESQGILPNKRVVIKPGKPNEGAYVIHYYVMISQTKLSRGGVLLYAVIKLTMYCMIPVAKQGNSKTLTYLDLPRLAYNICK